MVSLTTFYLSGIIGKEAFGADGDAIGVIKDLLISAVPSGQNDPNQQLVTGVRLRIRKVAKLLFLQYLQGCEGKRNDQRDLQRTH